MIEPVITQIGLSIQDIHNVYFENKKRGCSDRRLRGILKNFCRAGLLREEKIGKKLVYFPVTTQNSTSTTTPPPTEKLPEPSEQKKGMEKYFGDKEND